VHLNGVGRQIADALDAAAGGRAAVVGLVGPRGCGKTWWLDWAGQRADVADFAVLRVGGGRDDHEVPFGALAGLLGPQRKRIAGSEWAALHPVLELEHRRVQALDVKIALFRFVCELAEARPVCLLLDDTQWFDAASIEALGFLARRVAADAIAIVTTSTNEVVEIGGSATPLPPLPLEVIEQMLTTGGLDSRAAARCAEAARGNPGIARALANGLTDAQRTTSSPIPAVPRPTGDLVSELQARLRSFGDQVCRTLVVAAAEHDGDVAAVRSALATLGEHYGGLEEAEALGVLDIVGSRLTFVDPWVRPVAYHLVAPASRRAAHLALAGWFKTAEQAAQRAWHLAAGSIGPDAAVAQALELVADDAARRGGSSSAAITFERAAEFATNPGDRQRNLLAALRWWMEAGAADAARKLLAILEPLDYDAALAQTEARAFLDGIMIAPAWNGVGEAGWWAARRAERTQITASIEAGDHRAALHALNAATHISEANRAVLAARAHRQAGSIRSARESSTTALALLERSLAFEASVARLVSADLDILQGRGDDAAETIGEAASLPLALRQWASTLAARARLQADANAAAASEPDAFGFDGSFDGTVDGDRSDVYAAIRSGVLGADPDALGRAVALADERAWPIEAGEARLWLAALQPIDERGRTITLARGALQRCGVRAWDVRLTAMSEPTAASRPARPHDPGLDALSQAEFRVAQAVAAGLTNRQAAAELIISVKTVDFHLQQMYRKLGIRSRTELAVRMTNFEPARGGAMTESDRST
jgi:DNA-binding CsgD family transcriptional regulator